MQASKQVPVSGPPPVPAAPVAGGWPAPLTLTIRLQYFVLGTAFGATLATVAIAVGEHFLRAR